jgi:2,4-dienoyl-CoA reductase-like NADH-dependent reductase (Old Yellow Enzyme family)/thioredoxin reductase
MGGITLKNYPHILSPIRIGNLVLKNRLAMSRAIPTFISGVEDKTPFDSMIAYAGRCAASGASIVPLPDVEWKNPHSRRRMPPPSPAAEGNEDQRPKPDDGLPEERGERVGVDFKTRNNQMRYARAAEAVHNRGSLASMGLSEVEPAGWDINEIPLEYLEELPDRFAQAAVDYAAAGIDVGCVHMSYGGTLLCNSLSPRNRRQDRFGGNNIRERAALSLAVFRRVKEVCPDFLIEVQISGEEPAGGYTLADLCEYVRCCEGLVDIFQIRGATDLAAHPTGINSEKDAPVTLAYAEALKRTGTSAIIAPVGGYEDPALIEQWLAEGKCDMVYMARTFLAEPNYVQKLRSGEDVTPCLRCNKCHCRPGDPEFGCAVNPALALSLDPAFAGPVTPAAVSRRVAVIGGGPAGLEAALVAAQQGHVVTLYEQSDTLGGQMRHADYASFKWPLREFKDYLIRQVTLAGVTVHLSTTATPELLAAENYDVILQATGAAAKLPDIPGIAETKVWTPLEVYGHEAELGRTVVVIGGGETGVETAWHLAICGKQVTLISRQSPSPFDQLTEQYEARLAASGSGGSMTRRMRTRTLQVSNGCVTVAGPDGQALDLRCDDIVACGGVSPIQENFEGFSAICDQFRMIGDCRKPRDIRVAMKAACAAARSIE